MSGRLLKVYDVIISSLIADYRPLFYKLQQLHRKRLVVLFEVDSSPVKSYQPFILVTASNPIFSQKCTRLARWVVHLLKKAKVVSCVEREQESKVCALKGILIFANTVKGNQEPMRTNN